MNRSFKLILCASLCAVASSGFAGTPPEGPNCTLLEPPIESGESFSMYEGQATFFVQIYPRLSELPPNFTGCQVLWATFNGRPRTRALLFLRNGQVEAKFPDPLVPLCRPGERTIDTGCEPRQRALLVSFPPGCAARTVRLGKLPSECEEKWREEWRIHDALVE